MNTNEQINALVEKYGLSETVRQEIVKIVENEYIEGYNEGFYDAENK